MDRLTPMTPAGLARRDRRGVALIMTLWIVVVLALVYYSLANELMLESKLTATQKRDYQARHAAQVGVANAVVNLTNDLVIDQSQETDLCDSLGDVWAKGENVNNVLFVEASNDYPFNLSYSTLVMDEESKIDLNHASYEVLYGLLRVLEVDEDEAKETAAAIFDWRDPNLLPKLGRGEYESDVYAKMQSEAEGARPRDGVFVYMSKNDTYTTLEELLDVYGVTPELFYGYNRDTRRSRSRARRDPRARIERPDGTTYDQRKGLRDFLTVWSSGRVNVNTAPREVLAAIAMAERDNLSEALSLADSVIDMRGGSDPDVSHAFRTARDMVQATGFPMPRKSRVRLDVKSSTFRIVSLGEVRGRNEAEGIRHSVEILVRRNMEFFPVDAPVDDPQGIWKQLDMAPPWYKKARVHYRRPNMVYDAVVRVQQWIEW